MIACPNCRTENRDSAKRCKNCGAILPQPQVAPPAAAPAYSPQPAYPPQSFGQPMPPPQALAPKRSALASIPWASVGIGCLLLLIGFLLGVASLLVFNTVTGSGPAPTLTPTLTATPTAGSTPAAVAPTPAPTRPGSKYIDVTLKNIDDQPQTLSALIANKFAVVVFWTSDAKNDDAMTFLQNTVSDKPDKFVAIAINPKENRGIVKSYQQDKHLDKIAMLIDEGVAKTAYGVTNLPTYVLIGKDGVIADRLENASVQDLQNKVNALVK